MIRVICMHIMCKMLCHGEALVTCQADVNASAAAEYYINV